MQRGAWVGAVLLTMSLAACHELAGELLPAEASATASASAGATSGEGGAGGANGSSLESGSGGAAGQGGAGGAGGAACVPVPDACMGADCGEAFNGCQTVICGGCAPTDACFMGKCCTPSMPSCQGVCGAQDNGCGGTAPCDDVCGDGSIMTCEAGKCACANAVNYPSYDFAVNLCMNNVPGSQPYYCGPSPNPDAPPNCQSLGFSFPAGELWCCQ